MSTFLLIHGSWHGAWCWERLIPELTARGHRAVAIDLPAHGADRTPAWRASLGAYARRIREAAAQLPEKPLLVGHSMGGVAITRAACDAAEHYAGLVYLCAFVPLRGDSLLRLGRRDPDSGVSGSLSAGLGTVRFAAQRAPTVFYGDCSDADAHWAVRQLRPDPMLPMLQWVPGTPTLPRAYIACTRDRAISIGHQRAMAERGGIDRIVTLEADHSPFLSAPDELARGLDELASLGSGA